MTIAITQPNGDPLDITTLTPQRGVDSAHYQIAITNTGVADVTEDSFFMLAEVVASSGDYESIGHPAVDERWGRFQVTGFDSSGTAGQEVMETGIQTLGHLAWAKLPTIKPGNSIFADVWLAQPSASAGGGAVNLKFGVARLGPAIPVEEGVTMVGRGIDSGVNQPKSFIVSGRVMTATGTPDDQVHVALGTYVYQGTEVVDGSAHAITLNQTDSLSSTLATGESYYAAISQGLSTTPTTTKGAKSASTPDKPSLPLGEALIGFVLVAYGGSGSVIASGDLSDTDITYGRYAVTYPASGLSATVHAGEALTANFHQIRGQKSDFVLTGAATNILWLEATGIITKDAVTTDPPSAGALKLATLVTDGSHVTSFTDNRTYIGQAGTLSLHATTHATGGSDPVSPASIGAASTADLALKADALDAVLTGNPQAPTASPLDNSTTIATTAYVDLAVTASLAFQPAILFSGDGSSQPSVISDKPTVDNLFVYVNGLLMIHDPGDSGAQDYNYDDTTGQVTHTPVLAVGKIAQYRYI